METQSNNSSIALPPSPQGAPSGTSKWSLLADCSHSSAIAIGQRCSLAFRRDGLHAYGGYIEGFLPHPFDCEAIASDDKILAFLQLNDAPVELTSYSSTYQLRRGDAVVKFESVKPADVNNLLPPRLVAVGDLVMIPDTDILTALMDCVPKSGWGAMNVEMLGVVLDGYGAVATDNTSLAWCKPSPTGWTWNHEQRLILPRPFCTTLAHWVKVLGKDYKVYTDFVATVAATWNTGEVLTGQLPSDITEAVDFGPILDSVAQSNYAPIPDKLTEYLDEASIFSEEIVLSKMPTPSAGQTVVQGGVQLSTVGTTAWERNIVWAGGVSPPTPLPTPLKRLRTSLQYTQRMALREQQIHLSNHDATFFVIIATT